MEKLVFATWDYVVFVCCLLLSVVIGLRYAFTGGRQKTTDEFLMADRKMKYGPVTLSLMVSFISAITVLGVPSEVYIHGTDYCFLVLSYFICFPVVSHVFIPVFYRLKITSVYEYLELRFSKTVRICGTVTYMLMLVIYMGVVLYTPALALNAVTDINVWATVVVLCIICTLYTTLGGLKAVIWTDVFQAVIMIGGQILVIILGISKVGGLGHVWNSNVNGDKTTVISLNPSPFERHTVWTLGIGGFFMCLTLYGSSQTAVQRYLSCRTERDAKLTAYLNLPLLILVMIISGLMGMTIYANYHCNNPLASGAISKPDQLLIYYVMDLLGGYPGVPGLFVSCLFSAALSTISSCFNALATLTMQDLIKPHVKMSERKATLCSKFLAAGYGLICLVMSFIASTLGSVLIAAISIFGIMGGPLLGLFILGIFFRRANTTGALIGFFVSLIFIFFTGFGSIAYYILYVPAPKYALSDKMCSANLSTDDATLYDVKNSTEITFTTLSPEVQYTSSVSSLPIQHHNESTTILYEGASLVFKLSYMWYSGVSAAIVLIVGLIVSWITGSNVESYVDDRTLHPCVRNMNCGRKRNVNINLSEMEKSCALVPLNVEKISEPTGKDDNKLFFEGKYL